MTGIAPEALFPHLDTVKNAGQRPGGLAYCIKPDAPEDEKKKFEEYMKEENEFFLKKIYKLENPKYTWKGEIIDEKTGQPAQELDLNTDADTRHGVGVVVVKDGLFLVGTRADDGSIGGPGGHVEEGETDEQAAYRETIEEFGIFPVGLIRLEDPEHAEGIQGQPTVYFCTKYVGTPRCDGKEMFEARFMSLQGLIDDGDLFDPFAYGVELLLKNMKFGLFDETEADGGEGSGNFGHEGRPGKVGGSSKTGGAKAVAAKHKIDIEKDAKGIFEDVSADATALYEKSIAKKGTHGSAVIGKKDKDGIPQDTFSEKNKKYQALYDEIIQNEGAIANDMENIAGDTGMKMYGLDYSLKSAPSIERKIRDKEKYRSMDFGDALKSLGDVCRYTMIGESDNFVNNVETVLKSLEGRGYNIYAVENKFVNDPGAYHDISINALSPKGQRLELQFHTPESMKAKEAGHPVYEAFRDRRIGKKTNASKKLSEVTSMVYSPVPIPDGIERIKDYKKDV